MSYKLEMAEYIDADGLVHPNVIKSSNNGLTYLGYHIAFLKALHIHTQFDMFQWERAFYLCGGASGVLRRSPCNGIQNSIDDYTGVVCAAKMQDHQTAAKFIWDAGLRSHLELGPIKLPFFFNTERPGEQVGYNGKVNYQAWFGRFPVLIAMLYLATGKRSALAKLIVWLECLYTAAFARQDQTDPLMMLFMKLHAFGSVGLFEACGFLLKKRGVSVKQAFGEYFTKDHPFYKYYTSKYVG